MKRILFIRDSIETQDSIKGYRIMQKGQGRTRKDKGRVKQHAKGKGIHKTREGHIMSLNCFKCFPQTLKRVPQQETSAGKALQGFFD